LIFYTKYAAWNETYRINNILFNIYWFISCVIKKVCAFMIKLLKCIYVFVFFV